MDNGTTKTNFYVLNQLNDDARDSYLPIISKKVMCWS